MNKTGLDLPIFAVLLDGLGCLLLVGAILGATGVDVGLPVLTTIWPVLLVLGLALMVPIVLWALRKARKNRP